MPLQIADADILAALDRTGFPLEHQVTREFQKKSWNVLSGRYYIDDHDGQARELDLVAYRVYRVGPLELVSTVLVSCKKEGENTWAFLSRDVPTNDQNHDWCPVHYWTDEEPLASYLRAGRWKQQFEKDAQEKFPESYKVKRDIFAFQLIAPAGPQQRTTNANATPPPARAASPKNDTPIFNAITGLLKALHYERGTLPSRMAHKKRVYVFRLAVVVDAPLVDVRFDRDPPEVGRVNNILHLARYIVGGEQTTSLVQIESATRVSQFVKRLSDLAKFDVETVRAFVPMSYNAIRDTPSVQDYFAKRMKTVVLYGVNRDLSEAGIKERATTLDIEATASGALSISVDVDPDDVALINKKDSHARAEASKFLQKQAQYIGEFEFEAAFPF